MAIYTCGGDTTDFYYDPAGIRTEVIYPNGSKLIQPYPDYEEDVSTSGTVLKKRMTYMLAGVAVATQEDSTFRYVHNDHLGSASALMTTSGGHMGTSVARYKPFGGYLTTPTTSAANRGFTGHDRTVADDDMGLIYMNARYMMPMTGRFVSADTIVPDPASSESLNRFAYALNKPLSLTDPSGHCVEDPHEPPDAPPSECEAAQARIVDLSGGMFQFLDHEVWLLHEIRALLYAVEQLMAGLGGDAAFLGMLIGGVPITISRSYRDGGGAGWSPDARTIFINPARWQSNERIAWNFAHEVGHAVMSAGHITTGEFLEATNGVWSREVEEHVNGINPYFPGDLFGVARTRPHRLNGGSVIGFGWSLNAARHPNEDWAETFAYFTLCDGLTSVNCVAAIPGYRTPPGALRRAVYDGVLLGARPIIGH